MVAPALEVYADVLEGGEKDADRLRAADRILDKVLSAPDSQGNTIDPEHILRTWARRSPHFVRQVLDEEAA